MTEDFVLGNVAAHNLENFCTLEKMEETPLKQDDDGEAKPSITDMITIKSKEIYATGVKFAQSEQSQALQKRAKEAALDAKAKGTDLAKAAYSKGLAYSKVAKTKYESIPAPKRHRYMRLFAGVFILLSVMRLTTKHLHQHKLRMKLIDELDGLNSEASHIARENQQPLLRQAAPAEKKNRRKMGRGKK